MPEENDTNEENPDGKRCCVCFPLKYGLYIWGYFKMIVSAFFILVMSYALLHTCVTLGYNGDEQVWNRIYADIAITSVALTVFLTDLLLTMLFIVGAHQKNPTLISVFYYMSMVMSVHMVLKSIWCIYITIAIHFFIPIFLQLLANVIGLILQIYVIFLVRNEIIKLQNQQGNRSRYNVARGGAVLDNLRTTEEVEPL